MFAMPEADPHFTFIIHIHHPHHAFPFLSLQGKAFFRPEPIVGKKTFRFISSINIILIHMYHFPP